MTDNSIPTEDEREGEPSDDGHLITDCEHGLNSLYERCAPCEAIERLPRMAYPKTLRSHDLVIDPVGYDGPLDDLVREVQVKLAAEAARLRRLLPPPPPGFEWVAELNVEEHRGAGFRFETLARVRYRLVESTRSRHESSKWAWDLDDLFATLATHPEWTVTPSGDDRPAPCDPVPLWAWVRHPRV